MTEPTPAMAPAAESTAQDVLATFSENRPNVDLGPFADIAAWDPELVASFYRLYKHVALDAGALDAKTRELIFTAVDAATYFHPGTKVHIGEALDKGATAEEVFETLRTASLAGGMHVLLGAMPHFLEVLAARST